MTTDYNKVSLGFAEFVSQLIHETFDAILDAQNYQLDKYIELENALNTPNEMYKSKYISDDEFIDFQNSILGFIPKANMFLTQTNIGSISNILDDSSLTNAVNNNFLTTVGSKLLGDFCLNKIVENKKSKLRAILNHPELARLIIESGEITAKLELFCLNETTLVDTTESKTLPNISRSKFDIKEIKLGRQNSNIKMKELLDKETQVRTLIIDRNSLAKSNNSINNIPTSRLIANPLSATTTTNIFSQVTIKFKTI